MRVAALQAMLPSLTHLASDTQMHVTVPSPWAPYLKKGPRKKVRPVITTPLVTGRAAYPPLCSLFVHAGHHCRHLPRTP